ncbi:hypothetical protein B566_EDAN004955 [Ephemera danica]|nr:hypothetical protein B566_EDAN004955 [Ephemera danica]
MPAEIPGVDNETEPPKMPDMTTEHPNSEGPPPPTKESGTDENIEGGDENMEEGNENMEGGDENMEGGDENMEEGDENMEGGDGDIPTTIPGQKNQSAEAGNIYVVIFLAILLLVIVITVACMLLKRRKQQYDMDKCDVEMAKRNSCVSNEPEGGQIKFDNDELVEEDEDAEDPLITDELTKETPEERKSIIGVLEINVPGEADELLKTILIPVNGPSPDIAVGENGEMNVADNEENNSNNTENGQVPKDKETEVEEKVTNVKTSPIQTTEETEKVETAEKTEQIPPPENSEQVQTAEKTEQIPLPENSEQVQTAEKTEQIPQPENSEQVQTAEKTEQIPPPENSEQVQIAENAEQVKNPRLEPLNSVTSNELLAHNDLEQVTAKPVEEMPTFEEESGHTGNSTPESEQRNSIAPDEVNDEPAQIETTVD